FVWNLRGPDATKLPDNKGRGGPTDALTAPRVPPGPYQVRLTAGGRTLMQPFTVVRDPRLPATDGDLPEQYTWARRAHEQPHCVATDVPAFNALCRDAGVAAIVPKPPRRV